MAFFFQDHGLPVLTPPQSHEAVRLDVQPFIHIFPIYGCLPMDHVACNGPTGTLCAADDDEPIFGVTALESVGIEVDPRNQRLKRLPAVRLK